MDTKPKKIRDQITDMFQTRNKSGDFDGAISASNKSFNELYGNISRRLRKNISSFRVIEMEYMRGCCETWI